MSGSETLEHDNGRLWTALKGLEVALIGIDGKNGIRGTLMEFMKGTSERLDHQDKMLTSLTKAGAESERRFRDYLTFERERTCYGKAHFDKEMAQMKTIVTQCQTIVQDAMNKDTKTAAQLQKARLAMLSVVLVALITAMGTFGASYFSYRSAERLLEAKTMVQNPAVP
jgi:hypothetical protein